MSTIPRQEYLQRLRREKWRIGLIQGGLLIGALVAWEVLANQRVIDPFLVSKPSQIAALLLKLAEEGALWQHVAVTVGETIAGFLLGTILGLGAAILLWWFPALARLVDPFLVVLNSTPKIALGPIFIVWMGNGVGAILTMALTISVITTITVIYAGFTETPEGYIKLIRVFGGSRWDILRKVILPASAPTIVAALKVNIGLTLVGVIVGEFLVSKAGLGYLIIYGGQVFQLTLVIASIVILAVVAAVLYQAVAWLEQRWVSGGSMGTTRARLGSGG
ncbi:ABC transporter permease subunit [Heliobacterium gestii]|uniref:ABC transporter permease subunit n=1 Tax=Heliomicrobium gestii TaxID=2699 RepID=A0A845L8R5_HELGE|nr:ABC transporter permease [Heliomicrobium gestii]MBM7865353.1 NitT/TauT family transport system permease protein [Heliomicrobium gestii]MZP41614.1 ABC transporter permease subunit [Heliomicrobium gestii]